MADEPVNDDPIEPGETPEAGKTHVYQGTITRYPDEGNGFVLTDRLRPGDYAVNNEWVEEEEPPPSP